MSRQADIERRLDDLSTRVRHYSDGATETAEGLLTRGRRAVGRFNRRDAGKRITQAAEDFADEANYQYRRLRRQVNRHPAATVAIVAGTIGAFLLLRRVFRSDDED
jgi:hypothetical protein